MAPLFGPMAGAGASPAASYAAYAAPAYNAAPAYSGAAAYSAGLVPMARPRWPIRPGPPVRLYDRYSGADPSPAGVVGSQYTRLDRLFGPFASLGAGGGGPAGL